jgi:uncharacterized protein YheU (UPF0270 family)
VIVVPHQQLQPQTLQALIEDFVTRDGSVHGHSDTPLHARVRAVLRQLQAGLVVIGFDESAETFTILPKDEISSAAGEAEQREPTEE